MMSLPEQNWARQRTPSEVARRKKDTLEDVIVQLVHWAGAMGRQRSFVGSCEELTMTAWKNKAANCYSSIFPIEGTHLG
jgi:hypothetical protein